MTKRKVRKLAKRGKVPLILIKKAVKAVKDQRELTHAAAENMDIMYIDRNHEP